MKPARSTLGCHRAITWLVAAWICCGAAVGSATEPTGSAAPTTPADDRLWLFGPVYPLEVRIAFPAALLHWMDSLAGLQGVGFTGGKTIPAHRREYRRYFGELRGLDQSVLEEYRRLRVDYVRSHHADDPFRLVRIFFEADSLMLAQLEAGAALREQDRANFDFAVERFAEKYRRIWKGGERAKAFLEASSQRHRREVGGFMHRVAQFFNASPDQPHPAQIFPMPVAPGHGTHAQAIGDVLLLELRPGEDLRDQVAPVVHENAHFLHHRVEPNHLEALWRHALARGRRGEQAWKLLREALPTAIGQGVAGKRFQRRWGKGLPWYHIQEIDDYAKAIYPIIRDALESGRRFDRALLDELLDALPQERRRQPTRRSP